MYSAKHHHSFITEKAALLRFHSLTPHTLNSASSTWYDATLIDSPNLATLKHNITTILDRHYPPVEVANEWELDICIYWDMLPGFGGRELGWELGLERVCWMKVKGMHIFCSRRWLVGLKREILLEWGIESCNGAREWNGYTSGEQDDSSRGC
jgi:hypothetical protein